MSGSQVRAVVRLSPAPQQVVQVAPAPAPSLLDLVIQETIDAPNRKILERVLRRTEIDQLWRRMAARAPAASVVTARAARALPLLAGGPISAIGRTVLQEIIRQGIEEQVIAEWLQSPAAQQAAQNPGSQWTAGGRVTFADPRWVLTQGPGGGDVFTTTGISGPYPNSTGTTFAWNTWYEFGLFPGAVAYEATYQGPLVPPPGDFVTWYSSWTWTGPGTTPADGVALRPTTESTPPLPMDGERGTRRRSWREAVQKAINEWPLGRVTSNRLRDDADGSGDRQGPPGGAADGPGWFTAPRPPDGPPERFPTRARERKLKMMPYKKWLFVKALETATEACDLIGAVYNALPTQIRRIHRQRWVEGEFKRGVKRPTRQPPCLEKAKGIFENWRFLEVDAVVREILWEQVQDFLIGKIGEKQANALATIAKRSAPSFNMDAMANWEGRGEGPNTNAFHNTVPEPLMNWLQEQITQRAQRDVQRSAVNTALVRDAAIRERVRRRKMRRAEWQRRVAYRRQFG